MTSDALRWNDWSRRVRRLTPDDLKQNLSLDKRTGTVSYKADPRHAEMFIRQLQLPNAKSVTTPAEKKKLAGVISAPGQTQLDTEKTTLYRSLVMRAQLLTQDRADLSEAVKSLTRKMKPPADADMKDLKRLALYLVGKPRVVPI